MEEQKTKAIQNNLRQQQYCFKHHIKFHAILQSLSNKHQDCTAIDQWNRTEDPHISPHAYSQLRFDKEANTHWKENHIIFNKMFWLKQNMQKKENKQKLISGH